MSVLHTGQQREWHRTRSYIQVVTSDPRENLVTVRKGNGELVTCDPSRLRDISAYREIEREFAIGDRIQLTAPNQALGVASRDLGTLQQIAGDGRMTLMAATRRQLRSTHARCETLTTGTL
jgi:hypothetical protein